MGDTDEPNRTEAKRQVSQRGGYQQKWQWHVARGEGGLVAGGRDRTDFPGLERGSEKRPLLRLPGSSPTSGGPRGQAVGGQFLRRVGPHPWEGASPISTLKGSPHTPGWSGGCGGASLAVHLSQIRTEPDGQAASGSHMEAVTLAFGPL